MGAARAGGACARGVVGRRLDKDLTYGLEVECKVKREDVENYDEVRGQIAAALAALRDDPERCRFVSP